ncbi:hypothetical protein ACWD5Q_32085 [Streptomyces sp. NPDC002513]
MHDIKKKARAVLEITRQVEAWREDYDPGTDEWHTLCTLADAAETLVFALPIEMLPDEEVRTVTPYETQLVKELLELLNGGGK